MRALSVLLARRCCLPRAPTSTHLGVWDDHGGRVLSNDEVADRAGWRQRPMGNEETISLIAHLALRRMGSAGVAKWRSASPAE